MVQVAFGLQNGKVPEIREAFGVHLGTVNPGTGEQRDATVPEIKAWVREQVDAVVVAHRKRLQAVDESSSTED